MQTEGQQQQQQQQQNIKKKYNPHAKRRENEVALNAQLKPQKAGKGFKTYIETMKKGNK